MDSPLLAATQSGHQETVLKSSFLSKHVLATSYIHAPDILILHRHHHHHHHHHHRNYTLQTLTLKKIRKTQRNQQSPLRSRRFSNREHISQVPNKPR